MPASRSARAMIFAPRSCPSRPGFAITTLILRATARVYLEDDAPMLDFAVQPSTSQRPSSLRSDSWYTPGFALEPTRGVNVTWNRTLSVNDDSARSCAFASAVGYGTTGIVPRFHSARLMPSFRFGATMSYAAARFFRATAVERYSWATRTQAGSTGAAFGAGAGLLPPSRVAANA